MLNSQSLEWECTSWLEYALTQRRETTLMIVLKDIPSQALRNTFVDPIVFCIWEGDMTHSVCYRKPTTVRPPPRVILLILGNGTTHVVLDSKRNWNCALYPSCESHNSMKLMGQHFDWTENTLFFEEIPAGLDHTRTAFFLGGNDMFIDAPVSLQYPLCLQISADE